jgi:ribosome biogenesis GTPase
MNLFDLGWNENLQKELDKIEVENAFPGRVITEQKNLYDVITDFGEYKAVLEDKLWFEAFDRVELPTVGDWVLLSQKDGLDQLKIYSIMERKSKLARHSIASHGRAIDKPGTSEEQLIAANIDTVMLVLALDFDYNLRKIERYLTLMWNSGANPVIILNKADQCENPDELKAEVEAISYGIPVFMMSAKNGEGIEQLDDYLEKGKTITFIGSSGVGKSTIINQLAGEQVMETNEVREADRRGRHTTTHRQMIFLPKGGIVIDNPGIRDIKIIGSEENINQTFQDIVELQNYCKFRNCQHDTEPGCAVKNAIENGDLTEKRFQNYLKLKREIKYLERRKKERDIYHSNARSKQRVLGEKIKRHR